jgi:hypothetical protein
MDQVVFMCSYYNTKKKEDFRVIYNMFYKEFRVKICDIVPLLKLNPHIASNRINEALEGEFVISPQIRKRSFKNFKEYIYIVRCDDPLKIFKELKDNKTDVIYHAVLIGFFNLLIISNKKLDINGVVIVEGVRSDYYIAYASYQSFDKARIKMMKIVENFEPEKYKPKNLIKIHWDENIDWWDSDFELLYQYFKFNARKPYTPVMKYKKIASNTINHFLIHIDKVCTVFTQFFPNGMSAYDPYFFMIETDYEDFIIELFSELPTSPFFFKVKNNLFVYAHLERTSVREQGIDIHDVSQIWVPSLFEKLQEKGIIEDEKHAIFEYHWNKRL